MCARPHRSSGTFSNLSAFLVVYMSMLPDVASLSDSAAEASQAVKSVLDEVIAQEWQSSLKAFALKLGMDQCKLVEIASGHDMLAG